MCLESCQKQSREPLLRTEFLGAHACFRTRVPGTLCSLNVAAHENMLRDCKPGTVCRSFTVIFFKNSDIYSKLKDGIVTKQVSVQSSCLFVRYCNLECFFLFAGQYTIERTECKATRSVHVQRAKETRLWRRIPLDGTVH